jgi:DNA (cytosine-5)-methyltransferase 1
VGSHQTLCALCKHMTVVEICAGMGAMALGVQQAGYTHVCLVERDKRCVETLQKNGFSNIIHESVERVDFNEYRGASLVCGGVPCQSFSVAGKGLGPRDPRNLWDHAIRVVCEVQPEAFLFENSATMASVRHAAYLQSLITRFEQLGYTVSQHVVNAMHYGTPQCRKRLLLIGMRTGVFAAPRKTTPYPMTVREALASLGPPNGVNGHAVHSAEARTYRGHAPSNLDRPSHAVVSGVHGCPGGANTIRLDDGKYFTPRELAKLQTIPDWFALPSTWSTAVKQIGNAAPSSLVYEFARQIRCPT